MPSLLTTLAPATGISVSTSTTTSLRWVVTGTGAWASPESSTCPHDCPPAATKRSNNMSRIIFIVCKIRHKPPCSQMFSDYLVIIQTTKDTFIYVNVCEKSIPKRWSIQGKCYLYQKMNDWAHCAYQFLGHRGSSYWPRCVPSLCEGSHNTVIPETCKHFGNYS